MIQLNFYSFGEKKPEIGDEIIFLRRGYSFDYEMFEPNSCTVEGQWFELHDGEETGSAIIYDPEDPIPEPEVVDGVEVTYRLVLLVDGWVPDNNWYWMRVDDYWNSFDNPVTIDEKHNVL
jgi:hypothetical protein